MARRETETSATETKEERFKRTASDKITRKIGGLIQPKLDTLSDEQWATLAKMCRNKAGDALAMLAVIGLNHLPK